MHSRARFIVPAEFDARNELSQAPMNGINLVCLGSRTLVARRRTASGNSKLIVPAVTRVKPGRWTTQISGNTRRPIGSSRYIPINREFTIGFGGASTL